MSTTHPSQHQPGVAAPAQVDGLAVAGLYVGVCSIFLGFFVHAIPALIGIVLSGVALNRIRRSAGQRSGTMLALAGLSCGVLAAAYWGVGFLSAMASS